MIPFVINLFVGISLLMPSSPTKNLWSQTASVRNYGQKLKCPFMSLLVCIKVTKLNFPQLICLFPMTYASKISQIHLYKIKMQDQRLLWDWITVMILYGSAIWQRDSFINFHFFLKCLTYKTTNDVNVQSHTLLHAKHTWTTHEQPQISKDNASVGARDQHAKVTSVRNKEPSMRCTCSLLLMHCSFICFR